MTYIDPSELPKKQAVLIQLKKEFHQESKGENGTTTSGTENLKAFIENYLNSNGVDMASTHWKSSSEIELTDCPSMTLHGLALEAEKRGKQITYTRSFTIKISD